MAAAAGAGVFDPGFGGLFYYPHVVGYLTLMGVYQPELGRVLPIDPQHRVPFGSRQDLVA